MACSVAALNACSDDDENKSESSGSPATDGSHASALVLTTASKTNDGATAYLHVLADWPDNQELDNGKAIELGGGGYTNTAFGAIYYYTADTAAITKYTVDKDSLEVHEGETVSFSGYGFALYDPEPIYVSETLAFLLDEKSGQIARWNPTTMLIDSVENLDADQLERDGLNIQFQSGVAAGKRLFTTTNWRDWGAGKSEPVVALSVFDQDAPAGGPQLILEDDRCTPSASIQAFKEKDDVYIIGDGGLGYDLLANRNKTDKHQCVLRAHADADEYDPDFFVDLQDVTGSPAIYTAYNMGDDKLLVAEWSPDVPVADHAQEDPQWFWELPPYYEYAIVDLKAKTAKKVEGLSRAAIQFSKPLIANGVNYVQLYRNEDRGSSLHSVSKQGEVTQQIEFPKGTDAQFVGSLDLD